MSEGTRETPRTVSVIIPCYNAEKYVAEAIDSVLAQTYPWVDVIVVDDGSTDGSWEVVQGYGRSVHAFQKENGGAAKARNFGASRAIGQSLLFLDADDVLRPETLEALVQAIDGRDDVIGACPWKRLVQEGGEWVTRPPEVPFPLSDPDPLAAWLKGEWIAGCSLMWPRALFERLEGYDSTLSADEDGDLMYRALLGGAQLSITDRGESLYRAHGTGHVSVSQDIFAEHRFRSRLRVFERVEAGLKERGDWDRYRELVGIAYHGLAQRTYAVRPDLAAEALARGEAYAGRKAVAPTLAGRLLVRLLGMDGKERVANALARVGIMSGDRRAVLERNRRAGNAQPPRGSRSGT